MKYPVKTADALRCYIGIQVILETFPMNRTSVFFINNEFAKTMPKNLKDINVFL